MADANAALNEKEKELQIETGTILIIQTPDGKSSAESFFIGKKVGEYLVVTLPAQSEIIREAIFKEESLNIK